MAAADLAATLRSRSRVGEGRARWQTDDHALTVTVRLPPSGPHPDLCPYGLLVEVTNHDLGENGHPRVTLSSHRADTGRARTGIIYPERGKPTRLEQLIRRDAGPNPGIVRIEVRDGHVTLTVKPGGVNVMHVRAHTRRPIELGEPVKLPARR